jgi:hypothetical protein
LSAGVLCGEHEHFFITWLESPDGCSVHAFDDLVG